MDLKTGLSIYNKQWLIEPSAALQLLDFWEQVKAGNKEWDYQASRGTAKVLSAYQIHKQHFAQTSVALAPSSSWDMEDFAGFEGATVAVIPVSGPIMKADFCGDFGTQSLRQLTQMANSTESVETILFLFDTPGGTVDGTQTFGDVIKACTKRTVGLVDEMCCSAGYWIASNCDELYASSETAIIGSIGTMCAWADNTEAMKARGVVLREVYATESKDKNKMFTEAEKGNSKLLIEEHLDPVNDVFLSAVKANRAGKIDTAKENVLTGKTYVGQKAVAAGLVDGIQSFEQTVSKVSKGPKLPAKNSIFQQQNKKIMTAAEYKAAHPEAYAQIVAEGVTAERDRVGAFMAFNAIDPEAVATAITSGANMTQTQMSQFAVKAIAKQGVNNMEADSAATVQTGIPAQTKDAKAEADKKNTADFAAGVAALVGIKNPLAAA